MRRRLAILLGASALVLAIVVWALASLRDDDSSLRVLIRAAKERICWPANSSMYCAVKTMSRYEKTGRFDDAIKTGTAWATQHADGLMSGAIYTDISSLYLKKARMDPVGADEYLKQALSYRDKALQSSSDNAYSLLRLVQISEYVGNLSKPQQCIQYGNSLKILSRMSLLANEHKDRFARQFKPDLLERKEWERLSGWMDEAIKRISKKASSSGCQDKPSLAG